MSTYDGKDVNTVIQRCREVSGAAGDVLLYPREQEISNCCLCDAHETKTRKVTSISVQTRILTRIDKQRRGRQGD